MPLNSIEKVRSLVGDMNKAIVYEDVARGDGSATQFQLDMFPVRTGTLTIYKTGLAVTSATSSVLLGTFDLTGSAPANGDVLQATYQYNALSDDEIQACLDIASAAGTILAASYAARALAGNYARFFAYTQRNKSVNKDKLSDKLLAIAESLEKAYENNLSM